MLENGVDAQEIMRFSVGGGNRTHDLGFRRASLYPLSYTDVLSTFYYIGSMGWFHSLKLLVSIQ